MAWPHCPPGEALRMHDPELPVAPLPPPPPLPMITPLLISLMVVKAVSVEKFNAARPQI